MWLDGRHSGHAVGEHPTLWHLACRGVTVECCAAGNAQLVARLALQLGDAGMVAEAEVLLQQLYAAVQAVKVRLGLPLWLGHCSAPSLKDFCLISCSSDLIAVSKPLQPAALTWCRF